MCNTPEKLAQEMHRQTPLRFLSKSSAAMLGPVASPAGIGGVARYLSATFRRQSRRSRLAALQPAASAERDSGRVFGGRTGFVDCAGLSSRVVRGRFADLGNIRLSLFSRARTLRHAVNMPYRPRRIKLGRNSNWTALTATADATGVSVLGVFGLVCMVSGLRPARRWAADSQTGAAHGSEGVDTAARRNVG